MSVTTNAPAVVDVCTDKLQTFERLRELGFDAPTTAIVRAEEDLGPIPMPCIIKPTRGSGGSVFVFLAADREQAWLYARYLLNHGLEPIAQEYLGHGEGEFSLGVLSLPQHGVVASIAMRRRFDAKLSVQLRSSIGIISSPYGQGLIDEFPAINAAGRKIAQAIGSEGPLNIQGRVRNGVFVPFEINPRFSGSEYLRALAGVNQLHIMLQFQKTGAVDSPHSLKSGYYLRSLSEAYVPIEELRR
jgi:carbamoyl-phosphate synthase large subunit